MPAARDLVFWLPKLLDVVEQPIEWVLWLLVIALLLFWRKRERAARRLVAAATLLLAFLATSAIPDLILQRLENAFPPTTRPLADFDGVLVLGGALDSASRARERGQTLLGASAERVTTAAALARSSPHLKIVLTGYAGLGEPSELSEAAGIAQFFREQGLPTTALLLEGRSRNTSESAENTRLVPGVDPRRPWLLLTSASNMPRALLAFRKAGWNVEPLPVDYWTGSSWRFGDFSILQGASRWSVVLHELLGMAWYAATGRL